MTRFAALATLPLLWLATGGERPEAQRETVEIQEWTVPWKDSRPRDPYVGPDGAVWFVGQTGHYVARLDPRSGDFKKYDLEPGTGPHNLIVDDGGQIWFAGNLKGYIGKLDPATGKITRFPMPDPAARDPHTLVFDRAGDIWFTVQGGNFIGKLETKSGKVHLVAVPTERARPYGIVLDRDGRPWVNLFGSDKLATIDPATMKLREVALPRAEARSRRIGLTRDGAIWYVDFARGQLGRHDPASGAFREWATPGGAGSRPYAMAVDAQDRIWFVESGAQPNRLIGFDPGTGEFFSNTPIESGGGTVRHMVFHKPTGELWFGTDTNTIGRARIPRV